MRGEQQVIEPGIAKTRSGSADPVDWAQVRALLELHLKQGLRPRTTAEGKRVNPIRQLIWVMFLFGFFFVLGGRRAADLETFLILLFSSTFALLSLNILPDTLDARRRQLELIGSKPISSRTMLASRTATLFVLAVLISSCFSALPLLSTRWLYGSSWLVIPGLYLALIAGSFTVAILWITLVVTASRWLNVDRMRTFVQLLMVLVSIGLMGLSALSLGNLASGGEQSRFSFKGEALVQFLPSTWFANAFIGGFDTGLNLERAGALLSMFAALFIGLRVDLGKRYPELAELLLASDETPARIPVGVRALNLMARMPLFGSVFAPEASVGVASLVLTATAREVVSRLKVLAPRVLLIGFFFLSLSTSDAYVSPNIIAFYGFMSLIDGWEITKQSSHSQASWILLTSPLTPRELSRGIRLALMIKYFTLPAVLVSATFFFNHPPLLATVLTLMFLAEARAAVLLLLAARPSLPLSQEQLPAKAFAGLVISLPVALVTGVAYGLVVVLEEQFEYVGVAVGIICLLGIAMLSFVLEHLGRSRLAGLAYPH